MRRNFLKYCSRCKKCKEVSIKYLCNPKFGGTWAQGEKLGRGQSGLPLYAVFVDEDKQVAFKNGIHKTHTATEVI